MKMFHGSMRKKLIILVLLSTMPSLLIFLGAEMVNRQHAFTEAKQEATIFLNGFSEIQRRITDSTASLLRTVASMPGIRNADIEKSKVILSTLLETNPIYTNVILVDTNGDVVAAGRNHDRTKKMNFSDRKQFKEAISSKGLVSGEFVIGKSTKKSIFPFGMAVLDEYEKPIGVIIIGVNLSHFTSLYERGTYPENSFLGICDHKGIRLFRYPALDNIAIGEPIKKDVFQNASGKETLGAVITKGSDGLNRLILFEPIRIKKGELPYMYMFMGCSYAQIQKKANNVLYHVILFSSLSLVITLTIAWFVGGKGIAGNVEKLIFMTKKFASGEEKINSEIDYDDGEIGKLAKSFDEMISMLSKRKTERKDALEKLIVSEQRFRELIEDVSGISIFGYDEQRTITFWNSTSEKLYGYSPKEAIGEKFENLVVPIEMKEGYLELHSRWLEKNEKIPPGERVLVDKSGNDIIVFSSHVMHQSHFGKEMFCIDIDMRPLRQSEADRDKLKDQLTQAQKMEAIGTLAGGIAHDFNNILFPISGHAEILRQDIPEDSPLRESVDQIFSGAIRAADLVKQILTFSRQKPSELILLKLHHIVKEALKLLRSTIPTTIEIKQNINSTCGAVKADPTQIHQIIMNLVTNAYHSMEMTGGVLNISLTEIEFKESDRIDNAVGLKEYVCLIVKDTGSGMSKEIVEKIFDPFFTTKEMGKGTGLGLSVVHGIVKSLGGFIDVNSEVGVGSEFKVYFPTEKENYQEEENNSELSVQGGDERILLVDDEESIVLYEKNMLERLGYKISSFTNSVDALEAFEKNPEKYDLIISDVTMPILSGEKLALEMMAIRSDIPILLCTGYSNTIDKEKVLNLGIHGFLMKPVTKSDMAKMVRNILDLTEN